jgi:hypothetical protein
MVMSQPALATAGILRANPKNTTAITAMVLGSISALLEKIYAGGSSDRFFYRLHHGSRK